MPMGRIAISNQRNDIICLTANLSTIYDMRSISSRKQGSFFHSLPACMSTQPGIWLLGVRWQKYTCKWIWCHFSLRTLWRNWNRCEQYSTFSVQNYIPYAIVHKLYYTRGRRSFICAKSRTTRYCDSFIPTSIRFLNEPSAT